MKSAFKGKNVRQRDDCSTVQKPGFPLLKRLSSELGFLLDCDLILRHEHCENCNTLRLEEPGRICINISSAKRQVLQEGKITDFLPIQARAPALNGKNASRGQSLRNLSGLKA